MSMTGSRVAAMAAALVCALALAPPATEASDKGHLLLAERGIILRETDDWKMIRTPRGKIIKKRKSSREEADPTKQAPGIEQSTSPGRSGTGGSYSARARFITRSTRAWARY